jgi:hypothetical protein
MHIETPLLLQTLRCVPSVQQLFISESNIGDEDRERIILESEFMEALRDDASLLPELVNLDLHADISSVSDATIASTVIQRAEKKLKTCSIYLRDRAINPKAYHGWKKINRPSFYASVSGKNKSHYSHSST